MPDLTWRGGWRMTGSAHQTLDVVSRKLLTNGEESEGGVGSGSGRIGGWRISWEGFPPARERYFEENRGFGSGAHFWTLLGVLRVAF